MGRHPLRTADRGRPLAPQVSGPWATGSCGRTMKGGAPGEGLALTPHSPAPHPTPGCSLGSPRDSPEPPLPPWTCQGTPGEKTPRQLVLSPGNGETGGRTGETRANDRLRRPFSASLILQPAWPPTSVPPAPGSSIMGSQKPQTGEAAAPGGPFTLGKGLSAGPGRGAGRCHGCPYGEPPELRNPFLPEVPSQYQLSQITKEVN